MDKPLRLFATSLVGLCLLASLALPSLLVGPCSRLALAETTVFTYSGTGSGNTSPFTTTTSPWKVVLTANWTGAFTADICYQSSGGTARYSALTGTVSAGETYYKPIYGLVGNYYFHVTSAPAGGVWTIWVVENLDFPAPLAGSVFTDSCMGSCDTWPFTVNASPWRVGYITDWTGSFTVDVCSVSTGSTVRYSTISKSVTAGQMNEDWLYGLTGSFFFRVTGVPANGTWTIGIDDTFAPDRPSPIQPENSAFASDITPTFDWADVTDISGVTYCLQIDDSADFSSLVLDKTGLVASQYTLADNETLTETTFYWRVRAVDGAQNGSGWTDPWTVTIAPHRPSNISPTDNTTGEFLTPTLRSSPFSDPIVGHTHAASQWQVRSATGSYSSPVFDSSADNSNLTQIALPSGRLVGNTKYFWHVRHQDNHGTWSDWSTETAFTISAGGRNMTPNQPESPEKTSRNSMWWIWVTLAAAAVPLLYVAWTYDRRSRIGLPGPSQPQEADVHEGNEGKTPEALCGVCGQTLPGESRFCENCGAGVGKEARAAAKGVSIAAWVTIGVIAILAFFGVAGAFIGNIDEEGNFSWVKFVLECTVAIPLSLVIYGIAQALHWLVTRRWMDFRGRRGRFLR